MTDPSVPAITTTQLNRVYAAVDYLAELEEQDRTLTVEMALAMLSDLIDHGELRPMVEYIRRYCDVIDNAEQAAAIAGDI